ncbi:LPXTG-motif cell wall anchor domain-containing protein [Clostridium collagenovorans DSM 3089]|uniref:LPXTG-motif cell wall anchor domain-containing protein n=1 Tax=Clostridium collagenovorans DSM 3089 TaxID=1121306 RepID=A0A1M5VFM9_9CLOT|nr:metallophosphoesterase [Clostridium collagenovorans]SHH74102.1 LPXTG-motif cell wall anchor domain-containing protein [Clostridium collagenovorans DSM 3089]
MIRFKKSITSLVACAMTIAAFSSVVTPRVNATTLNDVQRQSTQVTLIGGNTEWKYEDTNKDMYTSKFYEKSFDDAEWKTGKGPFGYPAKDYSDIFGPVSGGTLVNSQAKPNAIITYYFSKDFNVKNPLEISKLEATVGVDDGFVMYINGVEVNRSYMDAGEITHSSEANHVNEPSSPDGLKKLDLTSFKNLLVEGKNKISVSVHNRDRNSSDIYFDMNLQAQYGEITSPEPPVEEIKDVSPKQVNAHMGEDPSTEVNLTYTTLAQGLETKAVLNKVGDNKKFTVVGENSIGNADKYFHKISVKNLEPNTTYEYEVGSGDKTFKGKFKTALPKGSKDSFKFAYIADPQVSNGTNAEAAGAVFAELNKNKDLSFVYLAGDITDKSTNEQQWELLFENGGAFPTGGQDMFGNILISAVQGNHDNNTLTRHINAPAEAGNIVYSYDYGPATFIMLNLEAARSDADARAKQAEYLSKVVKEAKDRNQWTLVGFHKSMYTGASHITDSDAIAARQFWTPIFSELDVDVVMQGHDHVYSRGYVDAKGYNANPSKDAQGRIEDPKNAPLYMVGGHAGGLKWYSKKNYTVGEGDLLAPGYSFLDVNSTDTGSDVKREQVIVEMEISNKELKLNTHMFKYDPETDKITTDKYLYDSMVAVREVKEEGPAEEDKKASEKVINKINALPEKITLEDKKAVEEARKAYNELTEAQKVLITKEVEEKLKSAEAKIIELEKAAQQEEDKKKPTTPEQGKEEGNVLPSTGQEKSTATILTGAVLVLLGALKLRKKDKTV